VETGFNVYKLQDQIPTGLKNEQPHHKVTTTDFIWLLFIYVGPKIYLFVLLLCICVSNAFTSIFGFHRSLCAFTDYIYLLKCVFSL